MAMVALLTVGEEMLANIKTCLAAPDRLNAAQTREQTVYEVDLAIEACGKLGSDFALFASTFGVIIDGVAKDREKAIKEATKPEPWWRR